MMDALNAQTEALHALYQAQLWCLGALLAVLISPMLRFDR